MCRPTPFVNPTRFLPQVVVTGLGTVTSLGMDAHEMYNSLLDGKCGIAPISGFDTENSAIKIGSEVKDFDINDFWDPKESKRYDRYTHLAMGAAKKALEDGNLKKDDIDAFRFGVLIGSAMGGTKAIEDSCRILFDKGPKRISPFLLPSIIGNTAGAQVAIELQAKGPNYGLVSACATGANTIGESLKMLQLGEADVMIAGGSEAALTSLGVAGYSSMGIMCTTGNDTPHTASKPFDAERDGFVMGEGAGVLLLETEAHAKARGAKIYCELAGYASTTDTADITSPDPTGEGMASCLKNAMEYAGVSVADVQYINAHGTGTRDNDKYESVAIKRAFGEHASKLKISSTKGALGHLLGAAGGVEACIACKALETGSLPPTINLNNPDPDCDLDFIPNEKHQADGPLDAVISQNMAFGGHNVALVFKKYTA